jgi:hypothetical protein
VISVSTYLRTEGQTFISATDVVTRPPYAGHVEGAIDMRLNGVSILDQGLWDDVDHLWAYICDMVLGLNNRNEVSTFFPDQPIKLTFKRIGVSGLILVSLVADGISRSASVDESSFIAKLQEEAEQFFSHLKNLLPENADAYEDALERVSGYKPLSA